MVAWQNSGEITAESIRRQQKDWTVTLLKSKLASKQMQRQEFNSMSFFWRSKYIRSGGRVRD